LFPFAVIEFVFTRSSVAPPHRRGDDLVVDAVLAELSVSNWTLRIFQTGLILAEALAA